jgi:hypothetical protein
LAASNFGFQDQSACHYCGSRTGWKLRKENLVALAKDFFVSGTFMRTAYGGAPVVEFNQYRNTEVIFSEPLAIDAELLGRKLGIGFFYYGPRLWMVGEIEPLNALQDPNTRQSVLQNILALYPTVELTKGTLFYRLRVNVPNPNDHTQYDSPPSGKAGAGRLDSLEFPVLYASQDIEVCIHECRATVEDLIFLATLSANRSLTLLDLTALIKEADNVTEFESLDLAIYMLFLAGKHSYEISRAIALHAKKNGLDGIIYPSYFSMLRTGSLPIETAYGLSLRRYARSTEYENQKIIRNLALFGRPLEAGSVEVVCINKLMLRKACYDFRFGPADISVGSPEDEE